LGAETARVGHKTARKNNDKANIGHTTPLQIRTVGDADLSANLASSMQGAKICKVTGNFTGTLSLKGQPL